MDSRPKVPVAVLGATGGVGQRLVSLLSVHPWFELVAVAASARSAGRSYGDAVRWVLPRPLPAAAAGLPVLPAEPGIDAPLVFSALDPAVAGPIEGAFARGGSLVVSNARSHRMDPDVPLVVPEVNPDHLALLDVQDRGPGGIVTNPNCATIGLVLALKPLADAFGVSEVHVSTLQAISGAGLPGPESLAFLDNVIPHIPGEEEKAEAETAKILGRLEQDRVRTAPIRVSAHCNRVPVLEGHTICASVALEREATAEELVAAWRAFRAEPQELALPSAPEHPTLYLDAPDAPQPRLHRDLEGGMAVSVGRLRPCPLSSWRFVCLSHNTIRGAAGGAILLAELAVARGRVEGA